MKQSILVLDMGTDFVCSRGVVLFSREGKTKSTVLSADGQYVAVNHFNCVFVYGNYRVVLYVRIAYCTNCLLLWVSFCTDCPLGFACCTDCLLYTLHVIILYGLPVVRIACCTDCILKKPRQTRTTKYLELRKDFRLVIG